MDSDSDTDSDDSSSEDEEKSKTEDGDFEIVPKEKIKKRKQLSAEELAIGQEMIKSKKRKRDLMDSGWNRFMSDDTGLPDWFVKEEEMHMKKQIELDPETVQKYRYKLSSSVSDPLHFDADPRICFRDNGSGSGSGSDSGSTLKSNKFQSF